jgi:manganese transport protein
LAAGEAKVSAEMPAVAGAEVGRSRSLPEVHASVAIPATPGLLRRLFAFSGPAYMVSVGYMDPGNWATDLEGGSRFGYELVWVLLLSNLMAVLLQALSARLGIVTGRDLAQHCRDAYSRPVGFAMWVLCEVAIAACDLAEVLGTAIALKLLFGMSLVTGVVLTALDVFLLLGFQRLGMRKTEGFILALIATIGACYVFEIFLCRPDWGGIARGFVPRLSGPEALYVAVAIIGATVMPHNLYLHSALVQTRQIERTPEGMRQANRYTPSS